jgi:RNA polymerase sigma-70 factor (ECF subfamily)
MSQNRDDDDDLMGQIAKGDSGAFRRLFEKHGGHVVGYATRYLQSRDRAEDVAQEVWIKVVRLAPSYAGKGHFVAWVYTMIRNHCLNELRSQKRFVSLSPLSQEESQESLALELPAPDDLENELLKKENWANLKAKIDNLPEVQRVALLLYVVEDLSYEEIAQELNATVSSVKSLLFRARRQLEDSA